MFFNTKAYMYIISGIPYRDGAGQAYDKLDHKKW